MKSPFTSKSNLDFLNSKNISPKEEANSKKKKNNSNSLILKNNDKMLKNRYKKKLKKTNSSPLMKKVKENRNINLIKNNKNKKFLSTSQREKSIKKYKNKNNKNILSRSESFSIIDNRKDSESKNKTKNDSIINNEKEAENEKIKSLDDNSSDNKENIKQIEKSDNSSNNKNDNINISHSPKNIINTNKVNKKIYKIESLSQVGYSGPGIYKYNQDNFFVYKNLNDENNVLFIGVCDGHGLVGHDVSKYLINNLPKNLNRELKKTNKYISHRETLYSTMKKVFINTNKDLCKNPNIDTQFSGSTCVTIILTKNKIISGNAGDSRAVMGRYEKGEWKSIDLSHDQKPNNPGEKERILAHGGRIEAYKDENGGDFGPARVWLKNEDVPGLAMSRSFGDEVAASVGTISEPEIEEFEITNDDKFIIIASDGIWEFISSQECVNFIKDFYLKKDLKGCLKFLLNESSKRWIKEEEVIDDITAVLIFFEE
jgi:serine/threonine protein phosphatase PrpC